MYTISVIPLIPGISADALSYISEKKYVAGDVLRCPFRNTEILGLVIDSSSIRETKGIIKGLNFKLKKIVKSTNPVMNISPDFTYSFMTWCDLYTLPYSTMVSKFFPKVLINYLEKNTFEINADFNQKVFVFPTVKSAQEARERHTEKSFILTGNESEKRALETLKNIQSEKNFTLFCTPQFLFCSNLNDIVINECHSKDYSTVAGSFFSYIPFFEILKEKGLQIKLTDVLLEKSYTEAINKKINIVNMSDSSTGTKYFWMSKQLEKILEKNKNTNKKTVLYVSRKGLATQTICADCRNPLKCSTCTTLLTLTQKQNLKYLSCNFCGETKNLPSDQIIICPVCKSHKLETFGTTSELVCNDLTKLGYAPILLDASTANTNNKFKTLVSEFKNNPNGILVTTFIPSNFIIENTSVCIVSIDSFLGIPFFDTDIQTIRTILRLSKITNDKILVQTRLIKNKLWQMIINLSLVKLIEDVRSKVCLYGLPPEKIVLEIISKSKVNKPKFEKVCTNLISVQKYKNICIAYFIISKDDWKEKSVDIIQEIKRNNTQSLVRIHLL